MIVIVVVVTSVLGTGAFLYGGWVLYRRRRENQVKARTVEILREYISVCTEEW